MKGLKNKFTPLIICIITILFLSCSSTNSSSSSNNSNKKGFVVDANNPPDQNAVILFPNYYTLKKWNDINIEKQLSKYGRKLIVPAGNNTMTFDVSYYYEYDGKRYPFKNVELQYDFEPEKKYWVQDKIGMVITGKSKYFRDYEYNVELNIWLYDTTKRNSSLLLKQWKVARPWLPPNNSLIYPYP